MFDCCNAGGTGRYDSGWEETITKRNGRVLVVDDEADNVEIITTMRREEYDLETASTGEEALEKEPDFKPDLIVLDIMMPGITGYEVCRTLKAKDQRTKIILVSAKAMPEDRVAGYDAGADYYISKPFDLDEFTAKIKEFVMLKLAEDALLDVNMDLGKE